MAYGPVSGSSVLASSSLVPFSVIGGYVTGSTNSEYRWLPVSGTSLVGPTVNYKYTLSSSFATASGSIIQALNCVMAKASSGAGDVTADGTLTSGRIIKGGGTTVITVSDDSIGADGIDLAASNYYSINGTSVLNATTLGSTIVNTSATVVGALDDGSITSGFGAIDNGTSNITSGGTWLIDVDGTAIGAAGALTMGTGEDAAIYWDGGSLVLDTAAASDIAFEVAGTEVASLDADGLSLASGDAYQIAGTSVLNATTLGGAVVNSSLTSVGTLSGLTVSGGTVDITDTGGDGTIDGVIIGDTTAAAGSFTTLSATGAVTLGDAAGDTITVNGTSTFANDATFGSGGESTLIISGKDAANGATKSYKLEVVGGIFKATEQ